MSTISEAGIAQGRRPVFGRYLPAPHPYDPALEACRRCGDPVREAVAENICYDHRVSVEREREFEAVAGRPRSHPELERAWKDYFEARIRRAHDPDYMIEGINRNNILVGGIENRRLIKAEVELGRIVDLNGLLQPFQLASQAGLEPFVSAVGSFNSYTQLAAFIDRQLDGVSPSATERFVTNVLAAMASAADQRPFQPSWVTTWEDLALYLGQDPELWTESLGVPKPDSGRWLIILRYTVGEAGTLARPTILDANWNGYHFPSPPQAMPITGGHPVDLRPSGVSPAERLSQEFVHSEIRHGIGHWIAAGRRVRRTTRATSIGVERRGLHHGRLVDAYGPAVHTWMPCP